MKFSYAFLFFLTWILPPSRQGIAIGTADRVFTFNGSHSQTSLLENPEELQLHHNHEALCFGLCCCSLHDAKCVFGAHDFSHGIKRMSATTYAILRDDRTRLYDLDLAHIRARTS
jgi:hypothetical protein